MGACWVWARHLWTLLCPVKKCTFIELGKKQSWHLLGRSASGLNPLPEFGPLEAWGLSPSLGVWIPSSSQGGRCGLPSASGDVTVSRWPPLMNRPWALCGAFLMSGGLRRPVLVHKLPQRYPAMSMPPTVWPLLGFSIWCLLLF